MKKLQVPNILFCVVVISLLLVSCTTPTAAPTAAPTTVSQVAPAPTVQQAESNPVTTKRICVSNSLTSDFFVAALKIMQKEGSLYGYKVDGFDNGFDAEKQVANYETCIAQKYDLIIIAPADPTALVPIAKKAFDAGIPVINAFDRLSPDADQYLKGYVGPKAINEGHSAGELTVQALNGKGNVVEIQGAPGNPTARDRHAGWLEILAKYPDIKVLGSDNGAWDRATSQTVMENFISAYGGSNINLVYCHDDGEAAGAIAAIDAAGLTGKIKVIGVNGNKQSYGYIKDGKQYATILNDLTFTALNSMRMARDIFENRAYISQQEAPALKITLDNVNLFTPFW